MYYKIVEVKDNKFYSQWSALRVEYEVGKWKKPEIGKLFVYDNLEFAKLYTRTGKNNYFGFYPWEDRLFLCEVKNPIKPAAILAPTLAMDNIRYIQDWWDGYHHYASRPLGWTSCKPVVLADEVKLLEEINVL